MIDLGRHVTRLGGGVTVLQISTDETPYMDDEWCESLSEAMKVLGQDLETRVLILRGDKQYFSAGASREYLLSPNIAERLARLERRIPHTVMGFPVPTVAAMEGHGIGGGLVFGLMCDVAYMAEESLYGANFMGLGFTPGMGSTFLLHEALGAPLSRRMLMTGHIAKGREIKEAAVPLSCAVLPRSRVWEQSLETAGLLAEPPRDSAVLLKGALSGRRRTTMDAALQEEASMHKILLDTGNIQKHIAKMYPKRD